MNTRNYRSETDGNLALDHLAESDAVTPHVGRNGAQVPPALLTLVNPAIATSPQPTKNLASVHSSINIPHPPLPKMIFQSAVMRRVAEQVTQLRDSRLTVLITGESGTGKELIARSIHDLSSRARHNFVAFNCAAAPRDLLESQLFGHRKGAFTGAHQDHKGMICSAAGGTLLLDEIGDLALELQSKLLRFLQAGEIQPVGEKRPVSVDVRVIAATNRNLEQMVAEGKFREDLWYRLNVIELHLPPLRERREEIPLLTEYFLERCAAESNKDGITIAQEAIDILMRYDWPGNVRQLENEIKRLVAFLPAGQEITCHYLSMRIKQQVMNNLMATLPFSRRKLADIIADTERQVISEALARHEGNLSRVSKELGITRNGLRLKLQREGIVPKV